jgi:hypothetical protein
VRADSGDYVATLTFDTAKVVEHNLRIAAALLQTILARRRTHGSTPPTTVGRSALVSNGQNTHHWPLRGFPRTIPV